MKVILLSDVKKVGRKGEVRDVANGYAMNVLIPQGFAVSGTPGNLKKFEKAGERIAEKQAMNNSLLAKNIEGLQGKTLTLSLRSNEKGTLFQTVHVRQVAEAIQHSFGVVVPESAIAVEDVRAVGEYTLTLSGGGVSLTLPCIVSGAT